MWSFIAQFLSDIVTKLLSQVLFTKTEKTTTIEKTEHSQAKVVSINTFNTNDLIKRYDSVKK